MLRDPVEDVSEVREPTGPQREAITLLELNPSGRPTMRLTLAQWRHVNRVVIALAVRDEATRTAAITAVVVPVPRPAADALAADPVSSPGSSS
jgi:hypothetical protein